MKKYHPKNINCLIQFDLNLVEDCIYTPDVLLCLRTQFRQALSSYMLISGLGVHGASCMELFSFQLLFRRSFRNVLLTTKLHLT